MSEYQDFFVPPAAFLDEDIYKGAETKIWHFSPVMSRSRIGTQGSIGSNMVASPNGKINKSIKGKSGYKSI
jgi:UDP-2-acetamido-3-amino-2,3-dideoxy-glucuronate N-acetyltransferase